MLPAGLARVVVVGRSEMNDLLVAALNGDVEAQFNVGVLYDSRVDDNGYAIKPNRSKAIKWLNKAARQGLAPAQYRLACPY